MQYRSIKGFSGAAQLGFLLVLLGLGFILAGGAQLIIAMKIVPPGTSFANMGDAMIKALMDPKNVAYSRFAQVLGTFFILFIPAVLFSWIVNGRNKFWMGFNSCLNIYQVLIGFLLIFTANIIATPLADITKAILVHFPSLDQAAKNMEALYNEQVVALSNLKSWPEFLMAVLIMAFIPALFEEMFFRGTIQNFLVKWWKQPLIAIIFTSLLFSFIHASVYLFLSRAILGFVLGWMYYRTKNIWVNVIAHFLNNLIAVAQLFSMSNSNKKINPDEMDPHVDWWIGLVAVGILFFLFRFLNKYSAKNRMKIETKERLLLAENTTNPFAKPEMN